MNFPEEQLGRVGQKFSDIRRKIEYIKTLDLVSCVAEVEQLCGEIQAATEEMRLILAMISSGFRRIPCTESRFGSVAVHKVFVTKALLSVVQGIYHLSCKKVGAAGRVRPSVRLVTPALSRLSYGCIKNPRTFLCRE